MSAPHAAEALTLPIVLVGLPGAGKSKVGRLLAQMLDTQHVDTDALVSAEAGMSIEDIFATEGEVSFRQREASAVERALQMPAVVSLGGGAVTTPPKGAGATVTFMALPLFPWRTRRAIRPRRWFSGRIFRFFPAAPG